MGFGVLSSSFGTTSFTDTEQAEQSLEMYLPDLGMTSADCHPGLMQAAEKLGQIVMLSEPSQVEQDGTTMQMQTGLIQLTNGTMQPFMWTQTQAVDGCVQSSFDVMPLAELPVTDDWAQN